jgi:hypothetical protein
MDAFTITVSLYIFCSGPLLARRPRPRRQAVKAHGERLFCADDNFIVALISAEYQYIFILPLSACLWAYFPPRFIRH